MLIESICVEIKGLYKNCLSIENDNLKCYKCKDNHTLSNGVCCEDNT